MRYQRCRRWRSRILPHEREHIGTAAYRMLTGCHPADATIDDDFSFDRHVLASILAVAAMENGAVAERAGLAAADLASLMAQWFPAACGMGVAWHAQDAAPEDDEIAMVRDLLLAQRSSEGDAGRWLAAMIARRAMEPNHLWEDLGLRDRSELTRLLARHFGPLAARNTRNMRWKRFFYRVLCEDRRPGDVQHPGLHRIATISTFASATRAARAGWRIGAVR